jgi:hypothetical protein
VFAGQFIMPGQQVSQVTAALKSEGSVSKSCQQAWSTGGVRRSGAAFSMQVIWPKNSSPGRQQFRPEKQLLPARDSATPTPNAPEFAGKPSLSAGSARQIYGSILLQTV